MQTTYKTQEELLASVTSKIDKASFRQCYERRDPAIRFFVIVAPGHSLAAVASLLAEGATGGVALSQLAADETVTIISAIGARVVRDARREAKKVGVEFDELGPLVVALAHGQELAELGSGEHGAKGGKAGELLGDVGAKVLRQEHRPVEGHVVRDQQRRKASNDVLGKLREGLSKGDALLEGILGRYAVDRRRFLGDCEAVRTDDVIAVEVL